MKFVALVSGGKDSFFNVLHCLKQGHQLVATANLYPADESQQELDSYMFQTVGHDVVSYYEKCTGLPIFRHPIKRGGSKNLEMNYTRTLNDEIEDLYSLLLEVKTAVPDIEAVSVGAILSSYQRTRVEDVCMRLNLIVLSYLWQRDQLELMTEMCSMSKNLDNEAEECGKLDARIIKVAAVGLDQSHLNKSLPQIFPTMKKLNQLYDVHICGEGGEFETMVLDAPFFIKGKLRVVSERVNTSDESNGVYSVQLGVEFEAKVVEDDRKKQLDALPVPPLLNDKWSALLNSLANPDVSVISQEEQSEKEALVSFQSHPSVAQFGKSLYVSNLRATTPSSSLENQTRQVLNALNVIIEKWGISPSQAINCTLILSSMSNFAVVNEIYSEYFDISKYGPLPPSRACIESNLLGKDCLLQLSVVFDMACEVKTLNNAVVVYPNKTGLHVQGRSYWAPCNIGPYSQAIWLSTDNNKVSYISGQIPLVPSSMSMVGQDRNLQSVLSLRHFDTLKTTIGATKQLFMTCFTSDLQIIPTITNTWSLYCDEMQYESDLWMDKDQDPVECLIIVKVSQLPRKALCEWGGISCHQVEVEYSSEEDEATGALAKMTLKKQLPGIISDIAVKDGSNQRRFITGFSDDAQEIVAVLQHIERPFKATVYFNPLDVTNITEDLHKLTTVEFIPVTKVFDYKGNLHAFGYHLIY